MREQWEEDGLIIEDNTIYEIDLNCYECLSEEEKDQYYKKRRKRPERTWYY